MEFLANDHLLDKAIHCKDIGHDGKLEINHFFPTTKYVQTVVASV